MLSMEHSTRIRDGAFQDVDVLVTGGGGFIGSHLAHRLVEAGARVRILDDFSTGRRANLDGLDIELFEASILDDDALARAVSGCRFVLHHAAFVSVSAGELDPEACRRINVDGTRKVVEASAAAGVHRLVNTSSSAIYGDQGDEPVSESCVPDPASEYARSKLESERLAREAGGGMDTVSLRYFNVFGPRQRSDSDYAAVIPAFVSALLSDRSVRIDGDGLQTRDFIDCGAVAEAVMACCLIESPLRGTACNIGSGIPRSIHGVLDSIARWIGVDPEVEQAPTRPGDIRHSCADVSLAGELLGLTPEDVFDARLGSLIDRIRQDPSG